MSHIDDFANGLFEEAKRFFEKAQDATEDKAKDAYLHGALMLAFCALEAHVNAIGDDFLTRPEVSVHDKGVLLEQEVRLQNGEFKLQPSLKITRLEDRVQFLHFRFSGKPLNRSETWWADLSAALKLRNRLTHPKDILITKEKEVGKAIQAVIDTLDALYQAIYKRKFPPRDRGMRSRMDF